MKFIQKSVTVLLISIVFFQSVQYASNTFSVIAGLSVVLFVLLALVAVSTYMVWREKELEIQKASEPYGREWAIKSCYPIAYPAAIGFLTVIWALAETGWFLIGWGVQGFVKYCGLM